MLHFFARRMKEAREDERGFTLIELLVVVIIIGILAAIAIPVFLGQRDRARDAASQSNARNGLTAAKSFFTGNSESYTAPTGTTLVAELNKIEPSLTFAAAASATDPQTVGATSSAANTVTVGSCSASGTGFWIKSIESGSGAGTFYAKVAPATGGGCTTAAPATISGKGF